MSERFLGLIEAAIGRHWELPALTDYKGTTYHYRDMAAEIVRLHLLFDRAGVQPGDRIALIGRNSSHWAIAFFAILSYGAVAVPVLHDFNPENVHHIARHSGAVMLLAAGQNWEKLNRDEMPDVRRFISLDDWADLPAGVRTTADSYRQAAEAFDRQYPAGIAPADLRFHREQPDELALINYTSGTTGFTKGVMLPYRSLWSNTKFAEDRLPFIHAGDNFVSMLPMAHMYGLAFEILNSINKGCHIHFLPRVPNPKSVLERFAAVRPTLIIAVPLIIEKIVRNNIFPALQQSPVKQLYRIPGFKQLIRRRILRRLNTAFGDRFAEVVIGGAAINPEVEGFLRSIGFRYTVGYGMTECGPLVAYEQWDTYRQGSVGRVVDRMEVKIDSPDPERIAGEILVRGTNTMLGYYANEQATADAMTADGWMRTGDLGTIDRDGFIYIRGRSKTMILSANGQNIYPEEIESVLNTLPHVAESLIVEGDAGKLTALIVPNRETLAADGIDTPEAIEAVMNNNLALLNSRMPAYSKVAAVRLMEQPFEKTPKQSIRRFLYQEAGKS